MQTQSKPLRHHASQADPNYILETGQTFIGPKQGCAYCGRTTNHPTETICLPCAALASFIMLPRFPLELRYFPRAPISAPHCGEFMRRHESYVNSTSLELNNLIIRACEYVNKARKYIPVEALPPVEQVHKPVQRTSTNSKLHATHKLCTEMRQVIYERFTGHCFYCQQALPKIWEVDSLLPMWILHSGNPGLKTQFYRAGLRSGLLVAACHRCNHIKQRQEAAGTMLLSAFWNGYYRLEPLALPVPGSIPNQAHRPYWNWRVPNYRPANRIGSGDDWHAAASLCRHAGLRIIRACPCSWSERRKAGTGDEKAVWCVHYDQPARHLYFTCQSHREPRHHFAFLMPVNNSPTSKPCAAEGS